MEPFLNTGERRRLTDFNKLVPITPTVARAKKPKGSPFRNVLRDKFLPESCFISNFSSLLQVTY
jgi:hypothetical protein